MALFVQRKCGWPSSFMALFVPLRYQGLDGATHSPVPKEMWMALFVRWKFSWGFAK